MGWEVKQRGDVGGMNFIYLHTCVCVYIYIYIYGYMCMFNVSMMWMAISTCVLGRFLYVCFSIYILRVATCTVQYSHNMHVCVYVSVSTHPRAVVPTGCTLRTTTSHGSL